MMNFHNNKTRRLIASIICILIVLAMIIPMVIGYLV